MDRLSTFIGVTLKGFLILSGLITCVSISLAIDLSWANAELMSGHLEHTAASVPALRHWGMMVFGIGVLMVVSAFRPWLRFETMVFCAIEKAFMVSLYLGGTGQPWAQAYQVGAMIDGTIVIYSLFYFVSRHGRPQRWVR